MGEDIVQELEARGEGARGADDRRGVAGDDRRSRSRWRWRGERGGVPSHHEEDQPLLRERTLLEEAPRAHDWAPSVMPLRRAGRRSGSLGLANTCGLLLGIANSLPSTK